MGTKGEFTQDQAVAGAMQDEGRPASGSRRRFLGGLTALPIALGAGAMATSESVLADDDGRGGGGGGGGGDVSGGLTASERRKKAYELRVDAAQANRDAELRNGTPNSDELRWPNGIASFSKSLPHNSLGEPDVNAFTQLVAAIRSGRQADFDALPVGVHNPLGNGRRLVNPQAGMAFDLEGADVGRLGLPPAPSFDSKEEAAEMAELYWMALTRDIPFNQWSTDPTIAAAAADLTNFGSAFKGPKEGGIVTPQTLFRDPFPGVTVGPWLSQFFLKPIPFGAQFIDQRVKAGLPGVDYMTTFPAWLAVQNGVNTPGITVESQARWISGSRTMCQFAHIDQLYQAYFNAMNILLGLGVPWDAGNPYGRQPEGGAGRPYDAAFNGPTPNILNGTQVAFGTLGGPFILALMAEVSTRALKHVWNEKWCVHRRLRPEEFGGRLEVMRQGARNYPIHGSMFSSTVLPKVLARNAALNGGSGTWLLSQGFPEGSPNHCSYGSGHATVAGACVTVLKAFFDENTILPRPYYRTSDDGLSLIVDDSIPDLTVGGELNKIGSNVAQARNMCGVHWRTDATEAQRLGEAVSISILKDNQKLFKEPGAGSRFTITKYDGSTISVG